MAEQLLIVELLQRGHRVAVPVVDDDGVDLIVDYRLCVQVKAASPHKSGGWKVKTGETERQRALRTHVDILAIYVPSVLAWWHIPVDDALRRVVCVCIFPAGHRGYSAWRDAWHVYAG